MPDVNLSLPPQNRDFQNEIQTTPEPSDYSALDSDLGIATVLFIVVFVLFFLFSWIYSVINILISEFKSDGTKIAWLLAVIFLPFTALIYIFVGKSQQKKKS